MTGLATIRSGGYVHERRPYPERFRQLPTRQPRTLGPSRVKGAVQAIVNPILVY
jgi:hypothetical protein